jgi:hypothetical protein
MKDFIVKDVVECRRAGKGSFKIIDVRGSGSSKEGQLQNVETNEVVGWFYLAHFSGDSKTIARSRIDFREKEAQKILNKKPRKR